MNNQFNGPLHGGPRRIVEGTVFTNRDTISIPINHHPLFRTQIAIQNKVERNLLFKTWGGIGDQICAEPTLRFALKMFKDCQVSLASELPELFKHLQFKRVFNLEEEVPNYTKYLTFETITSPDDTNMVWQFFSHMLVNCVDFPSMCALRSQLPNNEKDIRVVGTAPQKIPMSILSNVIDGVLIHPGKHWQTKTFPKAFWDRVLAGLLTRGIRPVIIGADADDNRSTVDVNTEGCLDFRNKLSISESIWACQHARVLLTNDSAPLHMAAAGSAWVGFVATCKHPDFITHWRRPPDRENNEWQWREKNFGKGGIWDVIDYCPNKAQQVEAECVPQDLLESWLPDPIEMAEWAAEKCKWVGLYHINCPKCGRLHTWFSGHLDQRCSNCKGEDMKDEKKAKIHNLSVEFKAALLKNDVKATCEVAQKIFDAGFELEDMRITPELFKVASNMLAFSGWTPKYNGPAEVQEFKEPQS